MKFLSTLFIVITFGFVSCKNKATQVVKIEDKYEITLPLTLSKQSDLNPEASLQYGNLFSELYTVVIDENSNEFFQYLEEENASEDVETQAVELFESVSLEDFFDACSQNWLEAGMQINPENFKKTQINNFPAYYIEIQAVVEGIDIHYNIGVLKGKKAFYQIYTWTLADRKDQHQQAMQNIIYSFKEL